MKAILLLLLSVGLAFGEMGDAKWQQDLEISWKDVFMCYPGFPKSECIKIVKSWDATAKKIGDPSYHNPNKPMIYMRLEMVERDKARKAQAAAREKAWKENENRASLARFKAECAVIEANRRAAAPRPTVYYVERPVENDKANQLLQNEIEDLKREQQRLKRDIRWGK